MAVFANPATWIIAVIVYLSFAFVFGRWPFRRVPSPQPAPVDLSDMGPRPYHKSERPAPGIAINRRTLIRINMARLANANLPMLSHAGFIFAMTRRPLDSDKPWVEFFTDFRALDMHTRHTSGDPDPGSDIIVPPSILRTDEPLVDARTYYTGPRGVEVYRGRPCPWPVSSCPHRRCECVTQAREEFRDARSNFTPCPWPVGSCPHPKFCVCADLGTSSGLSNACEQDEGA